MNGKLIQGCQTSAISCNSTLVLSGGKFRGLDLAS